MTDKRRYDVCIVGGGLAGLSLSIQLASGGYAVALFEKEQYPFHRVCGEYISLESWDFLQGLGLPLRDMNLPLIQHLLVSAPNGNSLQQKLPLGGFGISRYLLDDELKKIAVAKGVNLFERCKVENISFKNDHFLLETTNGDFNGTVCCGCFGKRSNMDIRFKRPFILQKNNRLNNYIGVKYHIKTDQPLDLISLHNFSNGYCGISAIEDGKYCLCYLTTAENLRANNNSVVEMERNVLYRNPHLKNIFETSVKLYSAPVTISQISFAPKTQVHDHILLLGDAAGMITPLCGNGMSMALHGSKIAAGIVGTFMQQQISRIEMERQYERIWKKTFSSRLATGRMIQKMFGKESVTDRFIGVMKHLPGVTNWLIRQTHGEAF